MPKAKPKHGPNRRALEEQVEAMATGQEHRALVEAARSLADRVDGLVEMDIFDDKAWREYRLALTSLREAVGDGGSSEDDIVAELRAEVRDS